MLCCANIYFNKQCLSKNIIPNYAKCSIPHTSPAAKVTQRKTHLLRITEEIKFLYKKKEFLNTQVYKAHLQAASTWGNAWFIISDNIHETIRPRNTDP
jgi:hypothetical protein